ncbi:hypothetical protein D3C86_2038090 [compost metagenome]
MAPFSSPAAKRSTSAWVFSFSVGKVYSDAFFATTGVPPSFDTVPASTCACALWWSWNLTAVASTGFCSRPLSAPT